jgi:hypothetical protein
MRRMLNLWLPMGFVGLMQLWAEAGIAVALVRAY